MSKFKKAKMPGFSSLMNVEVGDHVVRWLAGVIPQELKVTVVEDGYIHCGPWAFSQETGEEIDDVCEWHHGYTGSLLRMPTVTNDDNVEPKEGDEV